MSDADQAPAARRLDRPALVIAAALAVAAAVIFWDALSLNAGGAYAQVGPKTFPIVVSLGLFALAGWTAIAATRGSFPEREPQIFPPMMWIVAGLAAQLLLLKLAGFSIATGLLFAATAKAFGRGPFWMTIPIGIVLSLAVWLVFARLLQLSLPAERLEQIFL